MIYELLLIPREAFQLGLFNEANGELSKMAYEGFLF